jgi:HPt (histidine-containing phosphotransfer) domain-containing protein
MARIFEDMPGGVAAGAVADRPVDLVHLARQTLGNRDLEQEVLELFERQSMLLISRLAAARDEKSWREAAHTLKGSAQGIGANRVARRAAAVETLGAERGSAAAKGALAELSAAVTETNAFIRGLARRG